MIEEKNVTTEMTVEEMNKYLSWTKFPPESNARGVPVFWLVNNEEIEVPWGKVSLVVSKRNRV